MKVSNSDNIRSGSIRVFKTIKSTPIKVLLILFTSISLFSALPFFIGPGLTSPKPIGAYLNGAFPGLSTTTETPYRIAFPNLTFFYPITFKMVPNQETVVLGQLNGVIYTFDNDESTTVKNILLDLSDDVGLVSDGGFLGLTIHPDFDAATNPKNYFYVYYATKNGSFQDLPGFGQYTQQGCSFSEDTDIHGPEGEHQGNFLKLERFEVNPTTMSVVANSRTTVLKNRMYGTTLWRWFRFWR